MNMKIAYMVALLMIVLMVGCATKEEAAPAAPAEGEEAPAAPETAPVAPVEEAPVEEVVEEVVVEGAAIPAEVDQSVIDNLKAACERGAIAVCLSLKNQHGIDWPPEVVEEAEPEEPAEETPPAPTE